MNPIQLHTPDGRPTDDWQCTRCGHTHTIEGGRPSDRSAINRERAEECCLCRTCGKEIGRFAIWCEACDPMVDRGPRADDPTVPLTPDYTGPTWIGGNFFASVAELAAHLDEQEDAGTSSVEGRPTLAWAAKRRGYTLDWDDAVEAMDLPHRDIPLEGLDELRRAVERFNEANRENEPWMVDWTRAVAVPGRGVKAKEVDHA